MAFLSLSSQGYLNGTDCFRTAQEFNKVFTNHYHVGASHNFLWSKCLIFNFYSIYSPSLENSFASLSVMSTGPSLPLLIALITCPALLATNESIRQGQAKERREGHRARRCHLTISCNSSSSKSQEINGRQVVLSNGKLYISTSTFQPPDTNPPHPFTGYYLPYPSTNYEGLVSSISAAQPPVLNWIYVDQETYQVKYGVRVDAQPNLTGPFDCTKQDRRMTFQGWEGFVAVNEGDGLWGLYFDVDDDGLKGKLGGDEGRLVLDVELMRTEIKVGKNSS